MPRVELMRQDEGRLKRAADILGWDITELRSDPSHSYIVYRIQKRDDPDRVHKFARLYSQSTDSSVYHRLAGETEIIFIHGRSFDPDSSFGKGCPVSVIPEEEFIGVLTDWHMEALDLPLSGQGKADAGKEAEGAAGTSTANGVQNNSGEREDRSGIIHIVEENPLEQIYTQLRALTSKAVAAKAVERYAEKNGAALERAEVEERARGVSYLVQNAIDYYDNASTENITQRMLNLYYGTIALMEAEMLMYGDQYHRLEEIERVTKNGHGMATFGGADSGLDEFCVGVFCRGLFQAWLSHRGVDVSGFPKSKKEAEHSQWSISLNQLLRCIPELENILLEVDEGFQPGYLMPYPDREMEWMTGLSNEKYYRRRYPGSYTAMIDHSGRADEALVGGLLIDQTVIGTWQDSVTDSRGWRVYIHHGANQHYYDKYRAHKGLSASVVLKPLFGLTDDWEAYAVMILYAASIIVRYLPNLWARISQGDLNHYKAVFYQFSRVAERELTQVFLERLTGKRICISHPQGLI